MMRAKFDKETDGTLWLPGIFNKQADIERGLQKKKKTKSNNTLVVCIFFFEIEYILC